jgi:hypothetical protein
MKGVRRTLLHEFVVFRTKKKTEIEFTARCFGLVEYTWDTRSFHVGSRARESCPRAIDTPTMHSIHQNRRCTGLLFAPLSRRELGLRPQTSGLSPPLFRLESVPVLRPNSDDVSEYRSLCAAYSYIIEPHYLQSATWHRNNSLVCLQSLHTSGLSFLTSSAPTNSKHMNLLLPTGVCSPISRGIIPDDISKGAYHAAQVGIGLKARDNASRDLLFKLLGVLEHMKQEIGSDDAIEVESASAAFVENFALKVFQSADNEDRRGPVTRSVYLSNVAAYHLT